MSDIISQLITPQVRFVFVLILIFIALLYILSIIWVIRDSYLRGTNSTVWGIVALVPFVGAMAYAMMRPPLYASDREEQNIGLLLQQRELMDYGECPQCGYPTIRDYVLCPNCHTRLRNQCGVCGHTLEQEWSICPYCGTRAEDSFRQGAQHRHNVVQRRPEQQRPLPARDSGTPTDLPEQDGKAGTPEESKESASPQRHKGQQGKRPQPVRAGSSAPSESGRLPRVVSSRRPSSQGATPRRPAQAGGKRQAPRRVDVPARRDRKGEETGKSPAGRSQSSASRQQGSSDKKNGSRHPQPTTRKPAASSSQRTRNDSHGSSSDTKAPGSESSTDKNA
jgi:RNA polymerase subunit RPABC4/transcription elongation factor Spt4